jgi:hypothetical protein
MTLAGGRLTVAGLEGPVLPRIKTRRFLAAARALPGMTEDSLPVVRPMVADLVLSFAVDAGEAFVSVTQGLARKHGLDDIALMSAAFDNMAAAMQSMSVKRLGPVFQVEVPNDLSAGTFYVPEFWEDIKRQLGAAPVAIFAHRNLVCFTAQGDEEGLKFLQYAAGKVSADDAHTLSKYLYRWDSGVRWTTYPEMHQGEEREAKVQPLADAFGALDGQGRLVFPARFECQECYEASEVAEEVAAQALQARGDARPRPSKLIDEEAEAVAALASGITALSPDCFVLDFRCQNCDTAYVLGCEASRSASGVRYQPLKLWSVDLA